MPPAFRKLDVRWRYEISQWEQTWTFAFSFRTKAAGWVGLPGALLGSLPQGNSRAAIVLSGQGISNYPTPRMIKPATTPILIVTYRNPGDLVKCLGALRDARGDPPFEVFVCENGGPKSYEALLSALTADGGLCVETTEPEMFDTPLLVRQRTIKFRAAGDAPRVHVGEAIENLGYAGGINAWLRPLMTVPDWPAIWILNPDTQPQPDALAELATYSSRWRKGMVGCRMVPEKDLHLVHSRGLVWCKQRALACSVDLRACSDFEPDPTDVDARIDSPSGASMYVTRACIERIGLMDERYFLYFEDLEWGLRAKQCFGVGYAHRAVVIHSGGTTIGSSISAGAQSPLAVYLECRNSILFVRQHFPNWLFWTVALQILRPLLKVHAYRLGNLTAAFRGIAAGIRGETGRPDGMLNTHARNRMIAS